MNKILLFLLIGTSLIFPQEKFIPAQELPFNLFYFNEIEIRTTSNYIEVINGNSVLMRENINGNKDVIYSPDGNISAVFNYEFKQEKTEYPVTIFILNSNGSLINKIIHYPFFDLPHPIYSIDNNGELTSLDLFTLTIKVDKLNGEKIEYQLEREIENEMERTGYLFSTETNIYSIVTLTPADITQDYANVSVYSIEKSNGIINRKLIELSQLTGCFFDNENLIISGVQFGNEIKKKTIVFDNRINFKKEINSFNFEEIKKFNNKYAALFFDNIYLLNENFEVISTYDSGIRNRLKNLNYHNSSIYFISNLNNSFLIYKLNENFNIDFKKSLTIFDTVTYFKFKINNDKLFLNVNETTYISN